MRWNSWCQCHSYSATLTCCSAPDPPNFPNDCSRQYTTLRGPSLEGGIKGRFIPIYHFEYQRQIKVSWQREMNFSCYTLRQNNSRPLTCNKHLSLLYFCLRMNAQAKLIRRTIGKSANTAKSLRALKTTFRKCEDRWCISKSRKEFSFFFARTSFQAICGTATVN